MAHKRHHQHGTATDSGYLNAKGTFLNMEKVEHSLGHKSTNVGEFIHKHRRG